jgi:hypothetical protein
MTNTNTQPNPESQEETHFGQYDCPTCGHWMEDDPNTVYGRRWETDWGCFDWEETHVCPKCGTTYSYVDGNC